MGLLGWILNVWQAAGANRYWLGTTSTDPTNTANWSETDGGAGGASVPGTGDHAYFTSNGNNPCTLTAAWALEHLTVEAGYTAKLDLAIYDLTMDSGGNITLAGGGEFDCGSGSHSMTAGTLDYAGQTTFARGDSNWTFNGACNLSANGSHSLGESEIAAGATLTVEAGNNGRFSTGDLTVNGELAIETTAEVWSSANDVILGSAGAITGAGRFWLLYPDTGKGVKALAPGGVISVAQFDFTPKNSGNLMDPDVGYESLTTQIMGQTSDGAVALEAAAYTFEGNLVLGADYIGDLTLANNVNGPTLITVEGNLTLFGDSTGGVIVNDSGVGTNWIIQGNVVNSIGGSSSLTWTSGTGTITLSDILNQDVDFAGATIEDVVIDKSTGTVTLSGALTTDSFTGTAGTLDPNGQTITTTGDCTWSSGFDMSSDADAMDGCSWIVGGAFSADGQTLRASASWALSVVGTAAASGTGEVEYCDASGGTEIDASAGPWVDGGDNLNWSFGVGYAVGGEIHILPAINGRVRAMPAIGGEVHVTPAVGGDVRVRQ